MRDCADPLVDVLYQELTRAATPRPRRMRQEMRQLTATFHVSTPLFVGNAAQEPELLAAPFKRALRFWWRTLNYRYVTNGEHRFKELQQREARIFGRATDDRYPKDGRCPFTLRAHFHGPAPRTIERRHVRAEVLNGPGLGYLGYGLPPSRTTSGHACYWSAGGFSIEVEILFSARAELVGQDQLIDAIKIFGLLGGFGARSRRGFGSVSLVELRGASWAAPTSGDEYEAVFREILQRNECVHAPPQPEYTAFGPRTRIEIVAPTDISERRDALRLLEWLGRSMQRYRSWGRRVEGQPADARFLSRHERSEQNFGPDHKWFAYWRDPARTGPPPALPARLVFGLPHNYYSRDEHDHEFAVSITNAITGRRASPLMMHIHRLSAERLVAVLALFPAVFLPDDDRIVIDVEDTDPEAVVAHFSVIDRFFNGERRTEPQKGEPYFPNFLPVWPR